MTEPLDTTGGGPAPDQLPEQQPQHPQEPQEASSTVAAPPRVGGPSRLRVGIASAVTVGVVAVGIAAYVALQGAAAGNAAAAYLPADTAVYVQASAELPGDQQQNVRTLLQKFPGFEDQSTLERKLDDTFSRLLRPRGVDYIADVKPWLGSTVTFGVRITPGTQPTVQAVMLVGSKDDAKAQAFLEARARAAGQAATETYRGVTITTIERAGTGRAASPTSISMAVVDGQVAVSDDIALVRSVLDVRKGGAAALSGVGTFRNALATLPADRVGTLFLDLRQLIERAITLASAGATLMPGLKVEGDGAVVGSLRAESDGALADLHATGDLHVALGPAVSLAPASPPADLPKARRSRLDRTIPGDALLALDVHEIGPTLRYGLEQARRQDPELGQGTAEIDRFLALLGTNTGELLGALGDGALILTGSGDAPAGGLIIEAKDVSLAGRLIGQVSALLGLSGARVTSNEYEGVTIYEIGLPESGLVPGSANLRPAYALVGDTVVLGLDASFVRSVVDVEGGRARALAEQADYRSVMDRVGVENTGAFYANVGRLLRLVETGTARLPDEVRPYLEPIVAVGGAGSATGGPAPGHVRFFVLIR